MFPPVDRQVELRPLPSHYRESQRLYAELATESGRVELELNNGVTLALLGDDAGALEAYQRVLAADPENLRAETYKGNALMRLGRQVEAVQVYVNVLREAGHGEVEERARRILEQIAPEALRQVAPEPGPPPDTGSTEKGAGS